MARVHDPGNTMSPALRRTPKLSTLRASHATAVTGLPSTASLRPSATTSPLRVSTASIALDVDVLRRHPLLAQHETGRRRVVGDGVAQRDLPVLDPGVDQFDRRGERRRRGQHVVLGAARAGKVVGEDETDLDLDPRVQEAPRLDRHVLEDLHVGEQVAVVGLVDAHHLLHGLRRQPDLVADHPGAFGHPLADVDQLDLVGVDDVDIGMSRTSAERSAPAALGVSQLGSQLVAGRNTEHFAEFPSPC